MKNLKCQNHKDQKIIAACMDMLQIENQIYNTKCNNESRLCCHSCLIQLHSPHQKKTIDIDFINTFIEQESEKQFKPNQSLSYGQKQLIEGLEKLITLTESLKSRIRDKIEQIKGQNLQDLLKNPSNNQQQGTEYWNEFLEGILQYVEVDNCLIKLTTPKVGKLNEIEDMKIKIIKTSEEGLQKMINLIYPIQLLNGKLRFMKNRKNAEIDIIDQFTIKKTQKSSYAMAFLNEGFDPQNQSQMFAFKIQKFSNEGYIFFGVGNDEGSIVPHYILPSYSKYGHGQYMISSDAFQFHHTNEKLNCKKIDLLLKAEDKIMIKYDHLTKLLEFRKEYDQIIIKMLITDMTKILYPCVLLHSPDSQVQLVEY